jgi:phospholipase/lecithinase/hemolysin
MQDSYTTDGKHDGSTPSPAVLTGTNPEAGGRATNGLTWVEDLAADVNATIKDYAVGGAVINVTLWPASKAGTSDFISQTDIFLGQNNNLDPETTLYTSFFGINDWIASHKENLTAHLPLAAADYLALVNKLAGPPTNAKYWLGVDAYARDSTADAAGDAYKGAVFAGLAKTKLKWGFADLQTIWDGVLKSPGAAAFGYTSTGACTVNSSTTVGACSDPAHTLYWIPGHPSKETHRIMANYVEEVLTNCV